MIIVITKDRQPRSFRWTIRMGINQPNELGLSRAEPGASKARRAAERVFGSLNWSPAHGVADEHNRYVVEFAQVAYQSRA